MNRQPTRRYLTKLLGHTQIATTQIYARIIDNKVSNDMLALKTILHNKKSKDSGSKENVRTIA